jgi:hypothetical protein
MMVGDGVPWRKITLIGWQCLRQSIIDGKHELHSHWLATAGFDLFPSHTQNAHMVGVVPKTATGLAVWWIPFARAGASFGQSVH